MKRRSFQSKKKKSGRSPQGAVVQRQARPQAARAVAPPVEAAAPVASTPVPVPMATRYVYILPELKRIGILAGVMLVILVVLALVLP